MIKETIVVEGKDDIANVKRAVDAEMLATNGLAFGNDLIDKLKVINERTGIIIFTDPDHAGKKIREKIAREIPTAKHAYIDRKKAIKKGDLGVENADPEVIIDALNNAKAEITESRNEFVMADLLNNGLSIGSGEAMKKLYSPKVVKEIIDFYDFSFKKSLGQNFLIDKNFVDKIVESADIENQNVLEIGPGIGTITYEMAKTAKKVVAIEIDQSLMPILDQNLEEFDNAKVINEDILKVDLKNLVEEEFNGESFKVVSNLPYYITTPIIEKLITTGLHCEDMTIMVQKEVAERMVAGEKDKEYSSLSVFIKFYTDAKVIVNLPKSVFMPQPKIDSTILNLKLRIYDENVDQETLFKLVRAGFNKRRKTILNSMSDVVDKEDLKVAFEKTGLKANLRAENLSIDDYIKLANQINL